MINVPDNLSHAEFISSKSPSH